MAHITADDHAQAVEDLQGDGGVARHQRWVTDTSADDRAADAVDEARRAAIDPAATRRQRRAASEELATLTATFDAAANRWDAVGEPEADALRTDIRQTEQSSDRLSTQAVREQLDQVPARDVDRSLGLDLANSARLELPYFGRYILICGSPYGDTVAPPDLPIAAAGDDPRCAPR